MTVNALSGYYSSYNPTTATKSPTVAKAPEKAVSKPASLLLRLYSKKAPQSLSTYLSGLGSKMTQLRSAIRNTTDDSFKNKLSSLEDGKVSVQGEKVIEKQVKQFVDTYNEFADYAGKASTDFKGAKKLQTELSAVVSSKKETLENAGIKITPEGKLSIDDKKLREMITHDSAYIKEVFKASEGLPDRLIAKMNEVRADPIAYSRPDVAQRDFNAIYTRTAQTTSASKAAANTHAGLLVNVLI